MTMNHYYAWGHEDYTAANMGPIRTVGWHKFTFAIGPESVAMSVDGTLVFQTNMIRTARYLKLSPGAAAGWGRMDDLSVSTGTWPPVILYTNDFENPVGPEWSTNHRIQTPGGTRPQTWFLGADINGHNLGFANDTATLTLTNLRASHLGGGYVRPVHHQ